MIIINRTTTEDFTFSPDEIGRAFAEADDVDQVQFFNAVADEASRWNSPAVLQWHSIGRHRKLTDAAKRMLREIVAVMDDDDGLRGRTEHLVMIDG